MKKGLIILTLSLILVILVVFNLPQKKTMVEQIKNFENQFKEQKQKAVAIIEGINIPESQKALLLNNASFVYLTATLALDVSTCSQRGIRFTV